jgi:hypothetical protein
MIDRAKMWAREAWTVVKEPPSIAALVYALITFFGTQAVDNWRHSHDRYERQVEARINAFIDTNREFDALVASLASGIMDKNGPDVEDRTKLIANLNRQYSEIDDLKPLTKTDPQALKAYRDSIVKLNDQLPKVTSSTEMKIFWEALSDVLSARRKLDQHLMHESNLALD